MAKTINQMIDVMTAFSKGAKIEAAAIYPHAEWKEVNSPFWDWYNYDYRVKPEPREFAVLITSTGIPIGVGEVGAAQVLPFSSRDLATEARVIKVREVL
jgi:hypothetical protein